MRGKIDLTYSHIYILRALVSWIDARGLTLDYRLADRSQKKNNLYWCSVQVVSKRIWFTGRVAHTKCVTFGSDFALEVISFRQRYDEKIYTVQHEVFNFVYLLNFCAPPPKACVQGYSLLSLMVNRALLLMTQTFLPNSQPNS